MSKLTALLAGALVAAGAIAQENSADQEFDTAEPLRRYTVEIIIFKYAEDVSAGTEIFLPDELPPDDALLLEENGESSVVLDADADIPVYGDTVPMADAELPDEEPPPGWVVVPEFATDGPDPQVMVDGEAPNPFQLVLLTDDEFMLGDAIDRFERLDAYETLMHVGWTQPAFPEESTPAIELPLLGNPPEGLAGTFTLYLSRYLHLVVDIAMDAPDAFEREVIDDDAFFSFGDERPRPGVETTAREPLVRFRIQEDRILKNGELRYFDHPKFGVLARVMRVEEPEQELDAD
jgi:hypothetical protein